MRNRRTPELSFADGEGSASDIRYFQAGFVASRPGVGGAATLASAMLRTAETIGLSVSRFQGTAAPC